MALWPAHPKPLNDELLSSWLVRLAAANSQKLHTFSKVAWPEVELWNRDVDRLAPEDVLRVVSERTGTPVTRVREATLGAFAGRLFEKHSPNGSAAWLLPLGVFHRIRRNYGLQYCPVCLAEEPPYYRRIWRLAFVTICPRHDVMLRDRCPTCNAPINFHRGERGDRNLRTAEAAMTRCYACNEDLIVEPEKAHHTREMAELAIAQQKWLDALFRGYIDLGDGTVVYSHLFFVGLHILFQNFASGESGEALRARICRDPGWSPRWSDKVHAIERLDVLDRFELAYVVSRVLSDWPDLFVATGRAAKVVASDLMGRLLSVPFWYFRVVDEHFQSGTYSPTLPEIGNAIQYLRRRNEKVTKTSVSRVLGLGDVMRKRGLHWMLDG